MKLKTLRNLILIVPLLSMLGGCVLAFSGDDGPSHGYWSNRSDDSADRALARAVRTSLDSDSQTHAAAIRVYSDDGDVTLRGTVTDASVLGRAAALAAATPGVERVICDIVVIKR